MPPRAVLLTMAGCLVLNAQAEADRAVGAVLQRSNAEVEQVSVLRRASITEELDIVVALGSPRNFSVPAGPLVLWTGSQRVGLFLQEKLNPGRLYTLAIRPADGNCFARVERVTANGTVIVCAGDNPQSTPLNHKFVYDPRAKALVKYFSYAPFRMAAILPSERGAVFVVSDLETLTAIAYRPESEPQFRILGATEAQPWLAKVRTLEGAVGVAYNRVLQLVSPEFQPVHFGSFTLVHEDGNALGPHLIVREGARRYELPQSTKAAWLAARKVRMFGGPNWPGPEFAEQIGSYQLEDGRLWFGKTFYDGEGASGIGGFGYFDPADRQYHLFTPPEIADWSVTAMLVEPGTVWLSLAHRGEYGGPSGGMLQFDRASQSVRKIDVPDHVARIVRVGGDVLLATDAGIAIVRDGEATRYFVDRTTDGRLRVVASD